jgi:protocatechuate 3,4-dioxygenase beta subunit
VADLLTRRRLFQVWTAAISLLIAACRGEDKSPAPASEGRTDAQSAARRRVAPTPACDDGDDPTPQQTDGPFFSPRSPERASLLETGVDGTRLILTGRVLDSACQPIGGALLDFWQADADGEYDNQGIKLRGHQFTDAKGRYRLETIVPGLYSGRTRHIHVKAQPRRGAVLTTQVYFPGEPANQGDALFDSRLLMRVSAAADRRRGRFDFVLET